jgi:hypothetical protein
MNKTFSFSNCSFKADIIPHYTSALFNKIEKRAKNVKIKYEEGIFG